MNASRKSCQRKKWNKITFAMATRNLFYANFNQTNERFKYTTAVMARLSHHFNCEHLHHELQLHGNVTIFWIININFTFNVLVVSYTKWKTSFLLRILVNNIYIYEKAVWRTMLVKCIVKRWTANRWRWMYQCHSAIFLHLNSILNIRDKKLFYDEGCTSEMLDHRRNDPK